MVPVLLKVGMVPRERALLRRPGKEDGESLHLWEPFWCLMSLERLGGGVGTKESARSGDSKGGWQLKEGMAELPAGYLQHKCNVIFHKTVKRVSTPQEKKHYILAAIWCPQKANSTTSTVNAVNFPFLIMCQVSAQASYHSAPISVGCEHFIIGGSITYTGNRTKATGEKLHINAAQLHQISGKHSSWHVLHQRAFFSVTVNHELLRKTIIAVPANMKAVTFNAVQYSHNFKKKKQNKFKWTDCSC